MRRNQRVGRGLGLVVAIAFGVLLAIGSVAPWAPDPGDDGLIRLAWSARPERIERCRSLTDEELAGVPAHMRERVHCEGGAARYALTVRTNGQVRVNDTIRGGGARHEGMIHLLRELPVAAGSVRLTVAAARIDSAVAATPTDSVVAPIDSQTTGGSDRERRMEETRERVRREALPAAVALDTTITVGRREIVLIGYDPASRRFRVVRRPEAPS
ncbi:MAG: hypothetical protein ACKVZ0_19500 [Gemmatimonadales bacterium]